MRDNKYMKNINVSLNIIRKNSNELLKALQKPYIDVFKAILAINVIQATKYISPELVVRLTKNRFNKKPRPITENISCTLTIGKPNYLEREFIKLCQDAKEPFPIKKVQLKLYNPPKKKLKR